MRKIIEHLNLKLLIFCRLTTTFNVSISKEILNFHGDIILTTSMKQCKGITVFWLPVKDPLGNS